MGSAAGKFFGGGWGKGGGWQFIPCVHSMAVFGRCRASKANESLVENGTRPCELGKATRGVRGRGATTFPGSKVLIVLSTTKSNELQWRSNLRYVRENVR